MKKFLLLYSFVFALSTAWAQDRVVSGRVSASEDGGSLPGVNVVLKGTTNGTVTDADGNYKLNIPSAGGSLVFSFIGLQTQEIEIGERSVVDISLGLDVKQLSEVVVTAAGIEREKKALGYSVASVSGSSMQQRSEPDPLRALQGKMPGVNISGSGGAPGQSTRINVRGFSSLTGNTQPLFIVDGIPFDNSVNAYNSAGSATGNAQQGTQYSNRAFDLDPNNIESITVLKGAAAAALYGSRATNGVVVVTTKASKKSSKKGLEISYNGSVNFEEISGIPDYQDVYTQGSNQNYNGGFIGNWGAPFPDYVDGLNERYYGGSQRYSKVYATGYPEGTVPHPLTQAGSFGVSQGYPTIFPELMSTTDLDGNGRLDDAVPVPLQAYDIIGDFFKVGRVVENGVTINNSSDKATINAGISQMKQEGIVPNQEASRTGLNFGGSGQLDNGLFISGAVNYVHTTQQTPQVGSSIFTDYSGGAEGSIFGRIYYQPRNYDLNGYPFENPINGNNVYYRSGLDNPLWIAKYNLYNSIVNRVYGNLTFGYDITEWLNVTFKGGINTYSESRRSVQRKGGAIQPAGQIWINDLTNTEQDYNLIFSVTKDFGEKFNFRGIFGANANERNYYENATVGTDFIVPGLYTLRNTAAQINQYDIKRLRRLYGAYADLQFSYNKYLNLNFVMRNDWASTLPTENRSFFYPGASLAFVLTDATDALENVLSFAKFRAAYTFVGREADPYQTSTTYAVSTPFTSADGTVYRRASLNNTVGNLSLVNEKTKEMEFGGEFRHKSDRIGLDITYFKRNSFNQIVPVKVSPTSGFTEAVVNTGEIENKGWEIGLTLTPVKLNNGFQWDIFAAFTKIKSEVIDAGVSEQILIGGVGGGNSGVLQNVHKLGSPYGQIYGTIMARDEEGNILINESTGMPYNNNQATIIGDPNPDFTLGLTNTFSWKGITLGALIDWKQGGDFYSVTASSLQLRGQLKNQIDREGNRVVPGVYGDPSKQTPTAKLDENGNKIKNTTGVTAFDYHFSNGFGTYGADENGVYDGTVIRLREITLGYSLPKTVLSKTPFGSARISLSGRNLWWKAPNVLEGVNLDPEVLATTANTNVQGFETGATPTTKRYGVNVSLTF